MVTPTTEIYNFYGPANEKLKEHYEEIKLIADSLELIGQVNEDKNIYTDLLANKDNILELNSYSELRDNLNIILALPDDFNQTKNEIDGVISNAYTQAQEYTDSTITLSSNIRDEVILLKDTAENNINNQITAVNSLVNNALEAANISGPTYIKATYDDAIAIPNLVSGDIVYIFEDNSPEGKNKYTAREWNGVSFNSPYFFQKENIINVTSFGAVGDGITDDSLAFIAAQALATANGGGTIKVPYTPNGYKIGDGTKDNSATIINGITVTDNTVWSGENFVKIIVGSKTANGNYLFDIGTSKNTIIEGFNFEGQAELQLEDSAYVAISYSGLVLNSTVRNCLFYNFNNFAIQYATSNEGEDNYFENITIHDIIIGGVVGRESKGSGINFFPRSQKLPERVPLSKNLKIYNANIDVSNGINDVLKLQDVGETRIVFQGPQGIKTNAIDGIDIYNCSIVGGTVGSIVISNGSRNVNISATGRKSNLGLVIDTDKNSGSNLDCRTQNININYWKYDSDGAENGNNIGLQLGGSMLSTNLINVTLDNSNLRLQASQEVDLTFGDGLGDSNFGIVMQNVTINNGSFIVDDTNRGTLTEIKHGYCAYLKITGGSFNNSGKFYSGNTNMSLSNWKFDKLVIEKCDNDAVSIGGSDNVFNDITCFNGNPNNEANAWIIIDSGINNTFNRIEAFGDANNMDMFYTSNSGNNVILGKLVGTVTDSSGLRILNKEGNSYLGNSITFQTPKIDLSAPVIIDEPYFVCPSDSTLIGLTMLVSKATGAGTTKSIKIKKNGVNIATIPVGSDRASGEYDVYLNTSGVNAISSGSRKIIKGDIISYETFGSGIEVGEVFIQISLS